jgi:putative lipoic acid-binding regulatory protein
MSGTTLQEFPSEFPIKVMGRRWAPAAEGAQRDGDLRALTRAIVERHAGPIGDERIKTRTSADGNFLALTYTITAQSREQLDAIYLELTACKSVLMAL